MNWTKEQEKVIFLRNRNILVSAAAGSGKTAVLVERIIEMVSDIEHPVDIDHLLIVTFTNAAAGEMRERIGNAIEKRLLMDKDNLHLQKQMTLIHSAQITTIHSFCLSVIRNYFNEIDLDPGFRIGDEAELRLMKSDVLSEVLEASYEVGDENFLHFVESYATGKSDAGLEDMVLKLYDFSMSHPWPMEWLEDTKLAFLSESIEDVSKTMWMKELLSYTRCMIEGAIADNEKALALCEEGNGPYMYIDALKEDQLILNKLQECKDYEAFELAYQGVDWMRLSAKKDPTVEVEKREQVKEIRNRVKDIVKEIKNQYFFQGLEESLDDIKRVKPVVDALVSLTISFANAFAEKKAEKNILDFNDLEHFALKILIKNGEPTAIAFELRDFYEEILVDEYQDSNLVQETIVSSISRESLGQPNRFMVGDVKQSIYKFRLARPELFIGKYNTYTAGDSKEQRIDLHQNFRSRDSVLASINRVFEQIMHRTLGNIEYDGDAALNPGAKFPQLDQGIVGGKTEVLLLDGQEETSDNLRAKEKEAEAIATRIQQLSEEGYLVFDQGRYKTVAYQDMVILLRSMTGWAEEFVEVLSSRGIPAYADTRTGYFSAIEVRTSLNLLLIIDNPLQDIPLTSVLRSQIGGFTDEDLSLIRIIDSKKTMYESLCFYQEGENDTLDGAIFDRQLQEKIQKFLVMLKRFRDMAPYTSVYDLLKDIYKTTGYYDYVTILPVGVIRRGNLDMLLQKALDFEHTSYHGLFHFNRYIEKLHKYDIDFGEAGGDNAKNAVRIMSIHKSKGLEFPIVFVGGMGKQFNQQDARSRLILHPDMGIGPDYIDYEMRTKTSTLIKKVIQKKIVLENLAEELRILYVAMTRAKEKLILTGQVKDAAKKMESWMAKGDMTFIEVSSASSYFDWIMPCALHCPDEFLVRGMSLMEIIGTEMKEQISNQAKRQALLDWDSNEYLSEKKRAMINQWMNYEYPYLSEQVIGSKVSVSQLKKKAYEEVQEGKVELFGENEKEAYIPNFRQKDEKIVGARLGTLYHKVMECMSFETRGNQASLEEELNDLVRLGRLDANDIKNIELSKFVHLLESPLGLRMIKAQGEQLLYKEQPFVLGVPATRIHPELISDELVIVQGIIDAFFEENGELVLLDYKTDRVSCEMELINRYQSQLNYYQEALEQISGKKVKEKIIYSFYLEKEIRVDA
ncbi:MAG: helicase-exonuclease AddAB subunit AddA [Velocimicrobium sp.]